MTRQSEFKKKFNPDIGKFERKHLYGEGIIDSVKSFFGKKPTKKVKFTLPPPRPKPVNGTNKNAGNEIVKILSNENKKTQPKQPCKNYTQKQLKNKVHEALTEPGKLRLPPPPCKKLNNEEMFELLGDLPDSKKSTQQTKNDDSKKSTQQINNDRVLQILSGSGRKKLYNY